MIQETDERDPCLPLAPSKEIIIAWLENLFPCDMAAGKLTVSRVFEWESSKRFTFLERHIILEVELDGVLDVDGVRLNMGALRRSTTTLVSVYDGVRLILLGGSDRYKNAGMILRAEAVQLDDIDPQEVARFFNEITGWYQTVLQSSASQNTLPCRQLNFNEAMCTLPKPSVTGNAYEGWTISYWALRPISSGGCIPRNDPPELFEYTFAVSPQFEVTYEERSNNLYSKYNIRDVDSLNAALKDDFYGIRQEAVNVCGALGRAAVPTIDALVQCLGDMDKYDCVGYCYSKFEFELVRSICGVLQQIEIGPKANDAASCLIRYLFDENKKERQGQGLRYTVVIALMRLHPDPSTAPAIIDAIKIIREGQFQGVRLPNGSSVSEWVALIQLLGSMDPPAQSAVPFLQEMVASDPDAGARQAASRSLQSISSALGEAKGNKPHTAV